nr:hypothetical protein [Legionella quateirensis]
MLFFAFTGFQNGLILAGEVKNPQRNIPIAILGAVLIGFFFISCCNSVLLQPCAKILDPRMECIKLSW